MLYEVITGVGRDDARLAALHAEMTTLPQQVPGILDWSCGFNVTPDAEAGDYALVARFADAAALHAYFDHPTHAALLPRWADVAELRITSYNVCYTKLLRMAVEVLCQNRK